MLAGLISLLVLLVTVAHANTEKVIFLAPPATVFPDSGPSLDNLNLHSITFQQSSLRTFLPVAFPNEETNGLSSWYLLPHLNAGQRYEVRICWAAVQPTSFIVDVHNLTHVFDTPDLIQSLAAFSEQQRQQPSIESSDSNLSAQQSILFLRIQAAADFFTTNKTLMSDPPAVHVDIILDPYLGNVFPRSLLPTGIYITILAIGGWILSGKIWTTLFAPFTKERTA